MKKGRKQSFCHTHSFWMFVLPSLALFTIFFSAAAGTEHLVFIY